MRIILSILGVSLATLAVSAGPVPTRIELDALLGDEVLLEDFEGFSVHGGTSIPAANPLNSTTAPAWWGLLDGVTYWSSGSMMIYGGFLHGDDSNLLEATNGMTIAFNEPQFAVGIDIVNVTGNVTYTDCVKYYRGAALLGELVFVLPPRADAFAGWTNSAGITSITVSSAAGTLGGFVVVDNIGWGIGMGPCPADLSGSTDPDYPSYGIPDGQVDASDLFYYLDQFVAGNLAVADISGSADPDDPAYGVPDGVIDASDFFYYLDVFVAGCG